MGFKTTFRDQAVFSEKDKIVFGYVNVVLFVIFNLEGFHVTMYLKGTNLLRIMYYNLLIFGFI